MEIIEAHGINFSFNDGIAMLMKNKMKIRRNDPCFCGSGRKFKKCCLMSRPVPEGSDKNLFFMTFLLNAEASIKRCLRTLPPDNNIAYRISIGLLVRYYKIFNSIIKNVNDDYLATHILIRTLYETSLTLEYLLVKWDMNLFEEFVLTNAMRQRDLVDFLKTTISDGTPPEVIAQIKEQIDYIANGVKDDGLRIADLPKDRLSSWHRKLSYKQMANSLGAEAKEVFVLLYSVGSQYVHQSWAEINKIHIYQDKQSGNYLPNLDDSSSNKSSLSITICTTFRLCELFSKRFGDNTSAEYCSTLHQNFHKEFNIPAPN